jgi:3-hydroxyisobutyrate dehydrogenase-like beta-hydroxyacid dehydrogenase
MQKQPTVGILSPGDMGHAIGSVLRQHGLRVLTNLQGRSTRTASLAAQAGIIDVADDHTLVREADIFLSIMVPSQAYACAARIAAAMRATQTRLLFVDCNAIAPRSMEAIEHIIHEAGVECIDGSIIGPPPQIGKTNTRIYVSGSSAQRLTILNEYGLNIQVLGPHVGQASGLKMCYAAVTKGLTALATEALTAGQALGLTTALFNELRDSQNGLFQWFERQVPTMPPKASRWVGEMEEIAQTFADVGLPPQIMEGAAAMYRMVTRTELGDEIPEDRHRGQMLEDVTGILAASLSKDAPTSPKRDKP